MLKLMLAAMIIVIVFLGVMLVIKIRRISTWGRSEQSEKDGTPIRIPRELLELKTDQPPGEEFPQPDDPTPPPKSGDSRPT